jgi:hypothetical protein
LGIVLVVIRKHDTPASASRSLTGKEDSLWG